MYLSSKLSIVMLYLCDGGDGGGGGGGLSVCFRSIFTYFEILMCWLRDSLLLLSSYFLLV